MKTALIVGVSGQDGAYLARLLASKGYKIVGTSRDAGHMSFVGLERLDIKERVEVTSMSLTDFGNIRAVLERYRPHVVYNLAGQSSVQLSFEQPIETVSSITIGTLQLLEAIRTIDPTIRFYNSASGEMFGESTIPCTEESRLNPRSPYAIAKAAAYLHTLNYREAYGIHASSGILFNHESPLRPSRFVTRKVTGAAASISRKLDKELTLGNLNITRDWGFAGDYVEAMYLITQREKPADYVIATGKAHSLRDFVAEAFSAVGLDWRDHVRTDRGLRRPMDVEYSIGCPDRARKELGWIPKVGFERLVKMMVDEDLRLLAESVAQRR
jgi:GDPmannose 4,6-dehydratase